MPEYLTPGVYVEETSFRAKSIEGVSTSTAGISGLTSFGPVSYLLPRPYDTDDLPMVVRRPFLITSYTEFERGFGTLADVSDGTNFVGHAVRAFFANGGRRVYVSRAFPWFKSAAGDPDPARIEQQIASRPVTADGTPGGAIVGRWRARWPGQAGRTIKVEVDFTRSKNVLVTDWSAPTPAARVTGVRPGALIELGPVVAQGAPPPPPIPDITVPTGANLRLVARNASTGELQLTDLAGAAQALQPGTQGYHIQFQVTATMGQRQDTYSELALSEDHPRSLFKVLDAVDPVDEFALVWLDPFDTGAAAPSPRTPIGALCAALLQPGNDGYLTGGLDGDNPVPVDLRGSPASPDDENRPATALAALGEIDDIAIVMMPDTVRFDDDNQLTSVQDLLEHCERLRYRIAIVDPKADSTLSEVREFRSKFDSKYGALYYPWVEIIDPVARQEPGAPPPKKLLPPSGFVGGIYARSDIERGVHKAPANEVVLGITKFQKNITFDRQAVLNPEGINALRFFEGRSNRVWGARTMTSDPEWKYVNVRRLFIYLEHSIDKSTQWAVFEPNNERLWASIRQTIEDFLLVTWRSGALMGTKPEEAYFVRCDRTTMTQNDLDNGRMICLIGVAPTYPAEFVIFRIGQWTADAQRSG